jgi:hypothetical protein
MKRRTIDRRRDARVEMSNPALVSIPGRTPITDAPAVITDLSTTGMRLHMWIAPPKHKMANVRIDIDGVVHTISGRVVRVTPASEGGHDVGIEFDPEGMQGNPFPGCALEKPPANDQDPGDQDPVDDEDPSDGRGRTG